jgi:hypothetical protein
MLWQRPRVCSLSHALKSPDGSINLQRRIKTVQTAILSDSLCVQNATAENTYIKTHKTMILPFLHMISDSVSYFKGRKQTSGTASVV